MGWKFTSPQTIGGIAAAVLIAAGLFLFAGDGLFGGDENAQSSPGGRPPPVVMAGHPVSGTVLRELTAVGSLRSNESVVVQPEIAGRVAEILFEEGQTVEKGAPLIRLDDTVFRAEMQQADAQLALFRSNYQRALDLFKKGAASARSRDEAVAELRIAEANAALARALLKKTAISAPFDGVLGLRAVSAGDYVNPGHRVVNIEDVDPIKVDFRIPEIHATVLAVGQEVEITLDAVPGRSFTGTVYAIDPLIDPNGRAVTLRARAANNEKVLRPGMFARIRLTVEQHAGAILIPETSVFPRGSKRYVYRVVDGKAVLTEVETGIRRDGNVEIRTGLKLDDMVVFQGHIKLQDGRPLTAKMADQIS